MNDAFPPSAEVTAAGARLEQLLATEVDARKSFQTEFVDRVRLRALGCARGRGPSALESTSELRVRLSTACFEKADADLLEWMRKQELRYLLVAPALRPIPAHPPQFISGTNPLGQIRFAAAAGIAVSASGKSVEVIDVGTDKSLYLESDLPAFANYMGVSPNGRVLSLGEDRTGVVLRNSESGEILDRYPEHVSLIWLDNTSALLQKRNGGTLEVVDFNTGQMQPVKGLLGPAPVVFALPGSGSRFVMASFGSITKYQLRRDAEGVRLELVDQQPGPRSGPSPGNYALTSDGRYMVQVYASELQIIEMETLKSTQVRLAGANLSEVASLPDPNTVLVLFNVNGLKPMPILPAVFHLSPSTFAPVTDTILNAPPGSSMGRPIAATPIGRVGILGGKTLRFIDRIESGPALGVPEFVQYLQEQARQGQQNLASAEAESLGYTSNTMVGGVAVMAGPIAELARNARIEAVGVYEGASKSSANPAVRRGPDGSISVEALTSARAAMLQQRGSRGPVSVSVVVRKSDKPIVLCLSSYSSVAWQLQLMPGAQLKAVLLSSYEESKILGAGNVRVHNLGRIYAYDKGTANYASLQREVIRVTGQPISVFQGKYSGSVFLVGGQ